MAKSNKCGIYAIERIADGKRYYGSTINRSARWSYHKRHLRTNTHDNQLLQNAWNKYGEDAFRFLWIEDVAQEDLLVIEQKYLDSNAGNGFNLALYSDCALRGRKMGPLPESVKQKISDANKGKPWSEARRLACEAAMAAGTLPKPNLGKHHSDQTKAKISAGNKGKTQIGRPLTDAERQHLSEVNKGKKLTDEHRAKLSVAAQNRGPRTDEHCQHLSESCKGREISEEHRSKISATMTGYKQSEEHCQHKSEAMKLVWAKRKAEKAESDAAGQAIAALFIKNIQRGTAIRLASQSEEQRKQDQAA